MLKRTYLDRIYGSKKYSHLEHEALKNIQQLVCPNCKQHIGVPMKYAKENRLAYRLFAGAINKKITSSERVRI